LESIGVDVALIVVGDGPPSPMIPRHDAILCARATQTPLISAPRVKQPRLRPPMKA